VEAIEDDVDITCHNAGTPKNPKSILESVGDDDNDDDDDIYVIKATKGTVRNKRKEKEIEEELAKKWEETEEPEETDEDELGKHKLDSYLLCIKKLTLPHLARLQKDWRSKVYAFFQSKIDIVHVDGRKCHEFTCNAKNCKGKGQNPRVVRRYLDTKDKTSTKTLRAHAIKCWGSEIVEKSEDAKNIASAREALKGAELRDGSITAVFERTGKGKVMYSHRAHTAEETR
jgi:hypothetical protein